MSGLRTRNNPLGGMNPVQAGPITITFDVKCPGDANEYLRVQYNNTSVDIAVGYSQQILVTSGTSTAFTLSGHHNVQTSGRNITSITKVDNNGSTTSTINKTPYTLSTGVLTQDTTYTIVLSSSGCVVLNTPIKLVDGNVKLVQDLKPGDVILSYNMITNSYEPDIITKIKESYKTDIIEILCEDDIRLKITSGHPLLAKDGFVSYSNKITNKKVLRGNTLGLLSVGTELLTNNNKLVKVLSITELYDTPQDVYDITLKNNYCYLCGTGTNLISIGPSCYIDI